MQATKKERATATKEKVRGIIQQSKLPLSLAEIQSKAQIDEPRIAFSTVYRIIAALEKQGKVVRVDWKDRGARYEWADRPHHHHLVCESCQTVQDIDDATLNFSSEQVRQKTGFLVTNHNIELTGVCAPCRSKAKYD